LNWGKSPRLQGGEGEAKFLGSADSTRAKKKAARGKGIIQVVGLANFQALRRARGGEVEAILYLPSSPPRCGEKKNRKQEGTKKVVRGNL